VKTELINKAVLTQKTKLLE